MNREVLTVQQDQAVSEVIEMLVREHIHGVPVLDDDGRLVGVVTQQDLFFATVTRSQEPGGEAPAEKASTEPLLVRDVMTSPAVSATSDTELKALCQMMHRLRIHRVPIVEEEKVVGIVSSLDICLLLGGEET